VVFQQPRDRPRPLDEAVVHGLEQEEELPDVLQELRAENAIGDRVEGLRGVVEDPGASRGREPPQEAAAEELRHPIRRFEEVDGVAGGRGVHDDQVVATAGVDLIEPFHGDVVVALDELAGDVLVERVGQDGLEGGLVGRVQAHQVVPAGLRVQHRGEQPTSGLDAGVGEGRAGDLALDVAERLEAQGVGQALGGVDGQHQHPTAEVGSGHRRERGRVRRLAHASGATGDHHLVGGQELLERRRGRTDLPVTGRHQYPSSAARASASWLVARMPWLRVNSSGA
jgi:hypothetical protein